MIDATVVIGTFGDPFWQQLAIERAIPSAEAHGVNVIHIHADTLHEARNLGLQQVDTEWVCHLDADDELEDGFFTHMDAVDGDLRVPSVAYVRKHNRQRPRMPRVASHDHDCTADCLTEGNWLVVGTVARTALLTEVGGWRDWPMYEDWDLWLRCWQHGATITPVPEAVYRAHWRIDSRNRAPSIDEKNAVHHAIVRANLGQMA